LCRAVGSRGGGRVVYATVAVPDSFYGRLRGCPASFRHLVWTRGQEANWMKVALVSMKRRTAFLLGVLVLLLPLWAFFHAQIDARLSLYFLLNSKGPREEAFSELVARYGDPLEVLNRSWATGKVTHRALVATFLRANVATNPPWSNRAEPLLLAGSADGDLSVRELSLAALEAQRSPRLFERARAQLNDVDPAVRMLGLNYLRKADPQRAVPVVMQLLDDLDLQVVASAEVGLMRWSGEDYGVRTRLAIAPQEGVGSGSVEPGNVEAIRRGVELRKQWWQVHGKEFPASVPGPAGPPSGDSVRAPAGDFGLKDIDGKGFRLGDLRGKVVLLNFWATWCPSCLTEIPDLVALQNSRGRDVAIVGIALDGVPDEDGEATEQQGGTTDKQGESLKAIRAKVARVVKARGINYRILLDPHGLVGDQFNGGELPTTVILDDQGRVRRRFIGGRSPAVLDAMVTEANKRFAGIGPNPGSVLR
jgi:thiol-disulfide isomerase/thioredoxin